MGGRRRREKGKRREGKAGALLILRKGAMRKGKGTEGKGKRGQEKVGKGREEGREGEKRERRGREEGTGRSPRFEKNDPPPHQMAGYGPVCAT